MTLLDDTQPHSPFRQPIEPQQPPLLEPEPESGGSGCLWSAILGIAVLFALAIVGLAAAAGWTSGVRIAQDNATATHFADINNQIEQINSDIAQGNLGLVDVRLRYLATQTPGVDAVPQLQATATALYLTSQPTVTPTPTPTATETETLTTPEASAEPLAMTAAPDGGIDLNTLLSDAREAVNGTRWRDAIDLLDVIISVDPQFEKNTVANLMSQSLNAQALRLFRQGNESGLAEAIVLTNRAEQFGQLVGDVSFEREVAILYLNATSRINTSDYAGGIRFLNEVIAFSPNYLNSRQLLQQQYIAYGDALLAGGQPCSAVMQYTNAINFSGGNSTASGKRASAQTICDQGTPTPEGFIATPDPNNPVAPIGEQ